MLSVVIGIAAVVYYRVTPSVLDPVLWDDPSPLLKLDGALAPNSILQHAVKIAPHLHGPESTAFDDENGMAFVSFGDGAVRSFTKDGQLKEAVFFTGGLVGGSVPGNGVGKASASLQDWCSAESNEGRLAWDYEGERKCGRPLGLRFRKVDCAVIQLSHHYRYSYLYHRSTRTYRRALTSCYTSSTPITASSS